MGILVVLRTINIVVSKSILNNQRYCERYFKTITRQNVCNNLYLRKHSLSQNNFWNNDKHIHVKVNERVPFP